MSIIILNNKKEYLKNQQKLTTNKLMTLKEFKDNFFFKFDNNAIIYLMNKYSLNHQIAKIMLNNMYYLKESSNKKITNLINLKKELITNNLLTTNDLFKNYITNKEIIFDNNIISNDINLLKHLTNAKTKELNNNNYQHKIYKLKDKEQEIIYIASEITKLIKSNIDINKIYISNLNDEYKGIVTNIFNLYKIPINIKKDLSIYSNPITKRFIKSNFNLEVLKNNEVSELIINVLNKYPNTDYLSIKELIINDLKNTNFKQQKLKNAINEIDLLNISIKDDEYLFIPGFNQGELPSISKDELYLNDQELKELKLLTSTEMNKLKSNVYQNIIKNIKNIVITFKESDNGNEQYLSSINESLNYEIIKINKIEYNHSNDFNTLELAKHYEKLNKYGTISNDLLLLSTNYPNIKIDTYDNKYNHINKELLRQYLNNQFTLSYSTMDNYYKCSFKYYLISILKLQNFEEKFPTILGNIFHKILEETFKNNQEFETLWNQEVNKAKHLEPQNIFFLNNLKEELKLIIENIKIQNETTNLKDELYEEKITIPYNRDFNVTFKGFIDKIKYLKKDNQTLISIIDYKTGTADINLNNIYHGLGMQLPVYIYLTKNSEFLKDARIAGIFIHQILDKPIRNNDKKIIEVKDKNLKLKGYSNQDLEVIKELDPSYNNSIFINNLKTTSNGFYRYAKLLNDQNFEELNNIVEEKITNAIDNISNANFDINPKKITDELDGCQYCEYQNICYKKESDYIELERTTYNGGDEDVD